MHWSEPAQCACCHGPQDQFGNYLLIQVFSEFTIPKVFQLLERFVFWYYLVKIKKKSTRPVYFQVEKNSIHLIYFQVHSLRLGLSLRLVENCVHLIYFQR